MNHPPGTMNPTQVLGQIKILITAFLLGMLSFAGVTLYLLRSGFHVQPELGPPFVIALAILGLGSLALADILSRLLRRKPVHPSADSAAADRKRLAIYLSIKTVRAALAEAFGLTGTVFLLVSGLWYFLAAPILAAWILLRLIPRPGDLREYSHAIGPGASTHGGAIDP